MRIQSIETTVFLTGFSQSSTRPRGESYLVCIDGIVVGTGVVNEWHINGRSGKRTFAMTVGPLVSVERAVNRLDDGDLVRLTSETGNVVEIAKATARRETRLHFGDSEFNFEGGRRYRIWRDGMELLVYIPDSTSGVHEAIQLNDTWIDSEHIAGDWCVQCVEAETAGQATLPKE